MKQKALLGLVALLLAVILIAPSAQALQVTSPVENQVFYPGDTLVVAGKTSVPQQLVAISVYDPNNKLLTLDQVTSDNTGAFSLTLFKFPTEPRANFPEGVYTIEIKEVASGDTKVVRVTFTYITPTPTPTETNTTTTQPTVTVTTTVTQIQNVTITTTATVTATTTTTVTQPVTTTQTVEKTTTATVTQTLTETKTNTVTQTVTTPVTTTVTKTNTGAVAGAAIVALIIGLLVGFVAFRGKK
jgi:hypothetical protein